MELVVPVIALVLNVMGHSRLIALYVLMVLSYNKMENANKYLLDYVLIQIILIITLLMDSVLSRVLNQILKAISLIVLILVNQQMNIFFHS